MTRKQIVITLAAAAMSVSAVAGNAAANAPYPYNIGDENDTSWLSTGKTNRAQAAQPAAVQSTNQNSTVRFGDENDTSWLPTPARR